MVSLKKREAARTSSYFFFRAKQAVRRIFPENPWAPSKWYVLADTRATVIRERIPFGQSRRASLRGYNR